jgi:hypothetical protein
MSTQSLVDAAHSELLLGSMLEFTHQLQLWYITEAQSMDADVTLARTPKDNKPAREPRKSRQHPSEAAKPSCSESQSAASLVDPSAASVAPRADDDESSGAASESGACHEDSGPAPWDEDDRDDALHRTARTERLAPQSSSASSPNPVVE